jgi:hypothetical protein
MMAACGTATAPAPAPTTESSQIPIGLSEYTITVPGLLARPGSLVLLVTNTGAAAHNLEVRQGQKLLGITRALHPGQAQRLTVIVASHSGNLRLLCTLPGHAEAGMNALLGTGR